MNSIQDIIKERYSVRTYLTKPVAQETQAVLQSYLDNLKTGPLGTPVRLGMIAAAEKDRQSLHRLGTYGFIKNPTGFILGAVQTGPHALEDYGYVMEQALLQATALGLGTCWLGGSFTQSSFARKAKKQRNEIIPAVTSIGYPAPNAREKDWIRRRARADTRKPWNLLYFHRSFQTPLTKKDIEHSYVQGLEMVRIAPSASNKQPWRIVKDGSRWHFFCQRTPGYGKGSWYFTLLHLADLQRLDVGIAMCHFELTVRELGSKGKWIVSDPGLELIDEKTLYIASWEDIR
ncbi:MAG: nitroreductase family protein [Anaerolineales bacterium]|nr:nitroreductase family protein [Anaerolineales bacterium]